MHSLWILEIELFMKKEMTNEHIITPDELKKLHDTLLELLVEFDRICRKNDIPYSIDGGTLLGAVRHKGFIPWDDDADVILNRPAYDRLVKVIEKELDKDKFYFQDFNTTPGYLWGYAKLRKANTQCVRLNQEFWPYEQGVYLDIFVCDNVPENYILRSIVNFHSFIYRKLFYARLGRYEQKGIEKIIYRAFCLIPDPLLKKSYNRYISFRNRHPSKLVKCLTYPAINRFYGYKREWYEDTIDIPFEDTILRGCRNYDEYLRFLYGDYMKIPDEKDRKTHPVAKLEIP